MAVGPGPDSSEHYLYIGDIGDNQSIENHLSTYSYRLKNMKSFLRKCNENTLFLIDEFGTGSDPELGGALEIDQSQRGLIQVGLVQRSSLLLPHPDFDLTCGRLSRSPNNCCSSACPSEVGE